MRKLATALGIALIGPALLTVTAGPASAGCPSAYKSGTAPGTQPQVYPDNHGPIYVDDRDFLNGGGLWVYLESNSRAGLQRGGSHVSGMKELPAGLGSMEDSCRSRVKTRDTILF